MTDINVMLVDDHDLIIEGFKAVLSDYDINIVESCSEIKGATKAYLQAKPHVIILDIRFNNNPSVTGLMLCEEILSADPEAKVIIFSQFDQDHIIQKAYEIGAMSFVCKADNIDELVEAIRSANDNKVYFAPYIAQRLAAFSTSMTAQPKDLDEREMKIFVSVANGESVHEISEHMNISTKTVGKLTNDIKEKLKIDHSTDFTKLAIKYNLISID